MYLEITSPPSSLLLKDWLAGRPQESENEYICIFSINFITINLPTEAYTSTLGLLTYWLTDWLNCPHKALKKLANVETHIKVKLLQGFRQKVTWPTLPGGSNLDYVYSKGNMYKHWNKNPSTFLQSPPPATPSAQIQPSGQVSFFYEHCCILWLFASFTYIFIIQS